MVASDEPGRPVPPTGRGPNRPHPVTPGPGTVRLGLADKPPAALGPLVVGAWDAFLDVLRSPATDLRLPSRLPGWSGADTCIHLGSWPDSRPLAGVLASARQGGTGDPGDPDDSNARLVAAHRHEPPEQVVAAVQLARDEVAAFFAGEEPGLLGRTLSRSTIGPLPVLSLLHAATYELAVHALDLQPCGAPAPSALLLDRGLAALMDATGALAARQGVALTVTAQTPEGGWSFTSDASGWTTTATPAGPLVGVGVRGSAPDLLDASAGRTGLATMLLGRRLVVQDMAGFMHLAPIVTEVPGLPGGAALRAGVSAMSGVTGAVSGATGLVTGGVGRLLGRLGR